MAINITHLNRMPQWLARHTFSLKSLVPDSAAACLPLPVGHSVLLVHTAAAMHHAMHPRCWGTMPGWAQAAAAVHHAAQSCCLCWATMLVRSSSGASRHASSCWAAAPLAAVCCSRAPCRACHPASIAHMKRAAAAVHRKTCSAPALPMDASMLDTYVAAVGLCRPLQFCRKGSMSASLQAPCTAPAVQQASNELHDYWHPSECRSNS
jgi:hypothetical protein